MPGKIVYSAPGTDEIVPLRDLVYSNAEGHALTADLYVPQPGARPFPAVVMIHGAVPAGMTAPKDWESFVSWGRLIAASGMAAIAFNHRLKWDTGFAADSVPKAGEDVRALAAFLREKGEAFGVDRGRLGAFAFSAGGPLLPNFLLECPGDVKAMGGFYPFLSGAIGPSSDGRFDPLAAVERGIEFPPMLIAKAGRDMPMLNASIDTFVSAARSRGIEVELVEHPEGQHGFDILNDDDTSRAIIQRLIGFMRAHLVERSQR